MIPRRNSPNEHRKRTATALLATLTLAWAFFGVSSVALGRPKIALVHGIAVVAVIVLWGLTRTKENPIAERAHGGAAITVAALCGVAMFTQQGSSLACWYLLLVPMFVAQIAGWRAVVGWAVAGLACVALIMVSEELVTIEPEHVFTVLEIQIGALVITSAALGYSAYAQHAAEQQLLTDQRRREKIYEQAEELARVHEELATMHEQALGESNAKSRLMARVSHEIRTPLNGLLGLSEVLSDAPLDPMHLDMVRSLHASASSLRQLVDDLLDVTRIQEGKVTLNVEPVELRELLGDVMDTFAVLAQRKGIDLAAVVDASVPRQVTLDALRVRQVASNLVGNALKFTESGEVVIRLTGEADRGVFRGRIEVMDTGPGIEPELLPTLFGAYEQADDSLPLKRQGTGLGLWISWELARALSGELGATSQPGRGSTFYFTFQGMAVEHSRGVDSSGLMLIAARVLVVDPHEASRDALRQLAGFAGYELVTAEGLGGAVRHLKKSPVDIVVIDSAVSPPPLQLMEGLAPLAPEARFILARPAAALSSPMPAGFSAVTMKPYRASRLRSVLMDVLPETELTEPEDDVPSMRCLVVDDDETNRMVARLLLERAGQQVVLASDTVEAEAQIRTQQFDVLFQDVHMPGEDGVTFVKRLRRSFDPVPRLWIVALTAAANEKERKSYDEAGMDHFLAKPIEVGLMRGALERAYREVRRRRRKSSAGMLAVASIDEDVFDELASNLEDDIVPLSKEFVEGSAQQVADLRRGLADGDVELAHRAVHTLASSSALLGATSLADLSRVLEKELAAGGSPKLETIEALAGLRDQSVLLIQMRVKRAYPDS